MTVSPDHATVVARLSELSARFSKLDCHLRIQQPITLPPHDEPEPDVAVVRGGIDRYTSRHPLAADVLCVIEVADASLRRDRGYKQQIYADFGIGTYHIVNLAERVVETYTQPMKGNGRYAQVTTIGLKARIVIPTFSGTQVLVPVRKILP